MKKIFNNFVKVLLLIGMIFSDLMTPIEVLAAEAKTPNKGDVGINETVSDDPDQVTVSKGSLDNPGDVMVTKTVKKNGEGKFTVEFEVKGNNVSTTTENVKDSYTVFVLDASKSMDCTAPSGNNSSACTYGVSLSNQNTPWDKAKEAAIDFSEAFADKGDSNYLALVTFNSNGYQLFLFK